MRADLDGSNATSIVLGADGYGIAVDSAGGKVYWASKGQAKISRANFDGTGDENILEAEDGLVEPRAIALDTKFHKVYWSDYGASKIYKTDLDGSNTEVVVTNVLSSDIRLDLKRDKIYWTNETDAKIQSADMNGPAVLDVLTGTGILDVISGADGLIDPKAIALDPVAGKLYWIDSGLLGEDVTIQRSNLNGSSIETLLTGADGLSNPKGIALDTTIFVDFSMEINGDGTWVSPLNNLIDGVSIAMPGRTLVLAPGTSIETFDDESMITKSLKLINGDPSSGSVFIGQSEARLPDSGGFVSRAKNQE